LAVRYPRNSSRSARSVSTPPPPAPVYPSTAAAFATQCLRFTPDPTQARLLSANPPRCILNCSRQWGKSTVSAVKALHHALTNPESITVIISPSARQSAELVRKISSLLRKLAITPRGDGDNEISLLLPNHSRIVGLPGKDSTIRGFSAVSLLLIDEAARVPDELYLSVRPMLASSENAQLWLISTPAGQSGFFYQTWISPDPSWTRISVPATECPRISPTFLDEERRNMSPYFFRQEYLCEFVEPEDTVFPSDLLQQILAPTPPLVLQPALPVHHPPLIRDPTIRLALQRIFPSPPSHVCHYLGVDLGQKNDYTAICILERSLVVTGERSPVTFEYPTEKRFLIRYLERLPLGTPYPAIVKHVAALTRHPDLSLNKILAVDCTGVGQPVVDLFRTEPLGCRIVPVTLTSGAAAARHGEAWHIPRDQLLSALELAIRSGQLLLSDALPEAAALIEELRNLRRQPLPNGRDHISPLRESQHDDLVFATALAWWRATLYAKGV
jgi:hypothetical protein